MTEMRTIEIDIDVHKLIETSRTSFAETPNAVLRRLLDLGAPSATGSNGTKLHGRAWTGKGVTLPAGTELRMEYRGREHRGVIENAAWVVEGQRFKSPSAAAGAVAITKSGSRPSLDGWKYWQIKRPGDDGWIGLDTLR
ncbi:hypothetical protein [Mesorhizobium sp.]|uniref:restriction system modified-DNA reader domain-containing protein n=1 Tax=Mesorhizobium sp. TaxID=1871066 RepID=UPI000FE48268|nr:hypothetical protein [Mesorhizobium sp.]RWK27511.1 MAG: DUF2924 domain-containing protein [Mesorhizobium sp.]